MMTQTKTPPMNPGRFNAFGRELPVRPARCGVIYSESCKEFVQHWLKLYK